MHPASSFLKLLPAALLLALGLSPSACTGVYRDYWLPKSEISLTPPNLKPGASMRQVRGAMGLPDQKVKLLAPCKMACCAGSKIKEQTTCSKCAKCLARLDKPKEEVTGEKWSYRDYWWKPDIVRSWRPGFGGDRWGSWDLYFDVSGRLRSWELVESISAEPLARTAVYLPVTTDTKR